MARSARMLVGRQDQAFLGFLEVADRLLLGASGLGVRLLDGDLGDRGDHLAAVEVFTFQVVLKVGPFESGHRCISCGVDAVRHVPVVGWFSGRT